MQHLGLNPEPLHGAGGSMRNLTPDAESAGKGLLDSAGDASAAVFHPTMKVALDGFVETWAGPAHRLAHNVDAAGSQVQDVAVIGAETDYETDADLRLIHSAVSGHASVLSKPINEIV